MISFELQGQLILRVINSSEDYRGKERTSLVDLWSRSLDQRSSITPLNETNSWDKCWEPKVLVDKTPLWLTTGIDHKEDQRLWAISSIQLALINKIVLCAIFLSNTPYGVWGPPSIHIWRSSGISHVQQARELTAERCVKFLSIHLMVFEIHRRSIFDGTQGFRMSNKQGS